MRAHTCMKSIYEPSDFSRQCIRMPFVPNCRVLVVDDSLDASEALSILLEFEGYSVVTAQNGLDALNVMQGTEAISLLVLDLTMPVMDGWELLKHKRADAAIAEIPVIVLSALQSSPLEGVAAILKKPVNMGHLLAAIAFLLKN